MSSLTASTDALDEDEDKRKAMPEALAALVAQRQRQQQRSNGALGVRDIIGFKPSTA